METAKLLAAHVAAVNKVHGAAIVLGTVGRTVAAGYAGKKIRTAAGEPTAKFRGAILDAIAAADGATIHGTRGRTNCGVDLWIETSTGGAWLHFKGHESATDGNGGIARYHDTAVYLGSIDGGGVLTPAGDNCQIRYRADWTVAEVLAARARYRELEGAAREARGACGPFGD
jgi:hypothetical protein